MRHYRAMMVSMICLVVLLPITVFADSSDKSDAVYNFVAIWMPMILMFIWFVFIVKGLGKHRKRSLEHMAKIEQLLDRIATSLEKK
jgi:F0F1-type ATP synthase assembly protein I